LGATKPIPIQAKPDAYKATLEGDPPHYTVLISCPAMDASDLYDGEEIKKFIPHESTKDAFDIARNDFAMDEHEERQKNMLWYRLVFDEALSVEYLDKDRKKELLMEVIPASVHHDRINPLPLPELDRPLKDAVTGQVITDSNGLVKTEKLVVISKEGVGRIYWRVAIDRKGILKGAANFGKAKTAQEEAYERAMQAAQAQNLSGLAGIDSG